MRTRYSLIFFILMACSGMELPAQQKPIEVKPYTLETTYEKLKEEYPFIKPIEPSKAGDFKVLEDLAYEHVNGRELKADVYMPTAKAEKYPAVLLVHGGGWISGSKANVRPLALQLANHGYVAVTVEYRLSTEAVYPAAVKDLKAAIRWIRDQAEAFKIDTNRIAILGNSAGAQLATLVGVTGNSEPYKDSQDTTSDAVQAIINVDGIVSFTHPESEEGEVAAQWLDGSRTENLKHWEEASPLTYV
ncbi:MAG: alpha/beta hydrolase, partial [Bacteroidota bacterium]|nr:alpha/beta hydrolase [Bacteroidota bacterium]